MGIFEPYRALGYVTDGTPFSLQRRGMENFVTVSVGKAWQIYNCANLALVIVGPQLEKKIRALASLRDYTYVATGHHIVVFKRAHQVATLSGHSEKVMLLLQFGQHILSIGAEGRLLVWPACGSESGAQVEPVGELLFRNTFTPTCLMHPDTYLNKILIGSEEGSLQLWNISTCKMIYEFKGWGSAVRCCVSSPALDTVGIGCSDGKIHVHNLRYDETVVSFSHTTGGPITSLSFRTDGQAFLAAGGISGVISIWNLEKRKLQAVIKGAHESAVSSLQFLANEPVLLSAGTDNSLKMWIFDTSDSEARLLRFRGGHSAPPTCIRYYGNGGHILSGGLDQSFRVFSTIQDQQSRELSQGSKSARKMKLKDGEFKLPPVVAFDAVEIRERDWCNVVTCHMDESVAYTWSLQNFVIGEHVLKPSPDNPAPVKSCAISACGTFAVLGTEAGWIECFNLQSGIRRGTFEDPAVGELRGHNGPVLGLTSDATNSLLTSSGYDGFIKVWSFKGRELKSIVSVGSPVLKMVTHQGNGLVAVASDDRLLRLYDIVAARLVRIFEGHTDRVTDLCFSEDGKLLLSAAMDATVRVWDVVAAKQIDAMHVGTAVTALSLSPGMDMLATSHVNCNGIYTWANRLLYSGFADLVVQGSGKAVRDMSMPTVSASKDGIIDEVEKMPELPAEDIMTSANDSHDETISVESKQITPNLITLSMLPKPQWQGLINLDTIKIRNKPISAPKKPERAPFFLPSLPSLSGKPEFVVANGKEAGNIGNGTDNNVMSHIRRSGRDDFQTFFMHLLYECNENGDYSSLVVHIKSMSPSEVDAEFRVMEIVDDDIDSQSQELQDIGMVLDFLLAELKSNNNFEFIQALMQLFLEIHAETILSQPFLQEKAAKLWHHQTTTWQRLDTMFQRARSMISFISKTQL
ncbi:unnamed protein product [Sphagnum jensenii]|uniref:Uncharacterized protein n=1 Tax=Sphagnum jensenii TaxID=128206 RepID=A0ABP1BWC1_9BRYO